MATRRRIESPSKTPEQSPEGSRSPQRSEMSPQQSEKSPHQSRRSQEDALRLAFYMSSYHDTWETLELLKFVVVKFFVDTVVPSRCHRTILRWLHGGIAAALRGLHVVVLPS
jgi:hypothetical protein